MENINKLVSEGFAIFNIDETKAPVDRRGNRMNNWINKTSDANDTTVKEFE